MFDECHNIDNACIEGFTMNLNRPTLRYAQNNIKELKALVEVEWLNGANKLN